MPSRRIGMCNLVPATLCGFPGTTRGGEVGTHIITGMADYPWRMVEQVTLG